MSWLHSYLKMWGGSEIVDLANGRMGDDFTTKLDEFLARHRRLGTIDVLVQYLRVFDDVLAPAPYRQDVIERRCIRLQLSPRQSAAEMLILHQSHHVGSGYATGWSRCRWLDLRM